MASTRFGHLDDFTLKNTNVGIGTSTPQEKMEVIGGTRSQDLNIIAEAVILDQDVDISKLKTINNEDYIKKIYEGLFTELNYLIYL